MKSNTSKFSNFRLDTQWRPSCPVVDAGKKGRRAILWVIAIDRNSISRNYVAIPKPFLKRPRDNRSRIEITRWHPTIYCKKYTAARLQRRNKQSVDFGDDRYRSCHRNDRWPKKSDGRKPHGRLSYRCRRWRRRRPGLSSGPPRNFMQIISGSISASTVLPFPLPLPPPPASIPRRRFTFAFHAFTDFSPRWPTSRSSSRWKMPPWTTKTAADDDDVGVAGLPSFYFIFVLILPAFSSIASPVSDVFHCHPLFRLLLLTSFVRTSLQRKKGEKGCAYRETRGARVRGKGGKPEGDRLEVSLCSLAQNKISSSMNKVDTSPK